MQVEKQNPGAVLRTHGHTTYFCSERCRDRYRDAPTRQLQARPASAPAPSRDIDGTLDRH
jgi:YHS domain-containing protein